MIIGHRSFTFDGDGQLIEAETNPEENIVAEPVVPSKPPLPHPLVHKDSVLSSATSLSLTSYDSDSDTDEASGVDRNTSEAVGDKNNCELYSLQNTSSSDTNGSSSLLPGEQNTFEIRGETLPPISFNILSSNKQAVHNENKTLRLKTSTPVRGVSWKDMDRINSSPSILPVDNAPSPVSVLWTHAEERSSGSDQHNDKNGNLREYLKQRNQSALENRPSELNSNVLAFSKTEPQQTLCPNSRQLSFYKISDFILPDDCTSSLDSPESQSSLPADAQQLHRMGSIPKSSSMFLDKELRRKLSLNSSVDSYLARSVAHSPDLKNWSTSSVSSWESEKDFFPKILLDNISNDDENSVFDENVVAREHEVEINSLINRRRSSLKRQKNVDEEDLSVGASRSSNLNVNCLSSAADQADSFEMEEVCMFILS